LVCDEAPRLLYELNKTPRVLPATHQVICPACDISAHPSPIFFALHNERFWLIAAEDTTLPAGLNEQADTQRIAFAMIPENDQTELFS
jgi:hypothetical protein